MKLFKCISLLLFLPLLLAGCIKEDFSDCPIGIRVYFDYTSTYAHEDIDPSQVDRINLYAFDSEGILRGVWIDEHPNLSPDYFITVKNLPAGEYRFAAWGGTKEDCYTLSPTAVIGETRFGDKLLSLNLPLNKNVTQEIHSLFYAGKTASITSAREQRIYLPLTQNTNKINLTTEGLTPSGDAYRFSIADSNGSYYFDNTYAPCPAFQYTASCGKDAGEQPYGSLTVLRLDESRHPVITITNETQNRLIYSADLVELLNQAQVNYAITHVFDIHIKFNTNMSADVEINGWKVVDDGDVILR